MNFNAPEYRQLVEERKSKLTLMSLKETLEVEPRCASNAVDGAEATAIPRQVHLGFFATRLTSWRTRNPKWPPGAAQILAII